MFSIIETIATVVLLLLLMMFVLHLIRGDAADWLTSKFQVDMFEPIFTSQPDEDDNTGTTHGQVS